MRQLPFVALGTTAVAGLAVVAGCGGGYGTAAGPASAAAAPAAATKASARAHVAAVPSKYGKHLVDGRGRTLYVFTADHGRRSTCFGQCATIWPPLLTRGGPTAGPGARQALLSTSRRRGGAVQVDYAGHPLYTFPSDQRAGQITGEGITHFGGTFYVVSPAGKALKRPAASSTTQPTQTQPTQPSTQTNPYGPSYGY